MLASNHWLLLRSVPPAHHGLLVNFGTTRLLVHADEYEQDVNNATFGSYNARLVLSHPAVENLDLQVLANKWQASDQLET